MIAKSLLSGCLLACLLCGGLSAQHTTLYGNITDEEGEDLIGATIKVKNSVVGAISNVDGHYEVEVPTGRIRLIISYVGYQDVDTVIVVRLEDQKIQVDAVLNLAVFNTPEVVVFGRRATGQSQALKIQQSAPQQVSIVHAEVFNKYPDVSLAETVQRIPGVTISRSQGEAEFVQIRGIPEQFTVISLNGQRLPSLRAEADRAASLDLIQTNLIEEVYVNKTRTADMDADAIGGSIDFRLKQPDAKLEALVQAGLGSNLQDSPLRKVNRSVQQITGYLNSELSDEKVLGLLAGSYFRNGRNTDERLIERGFNGTREGEIFRYRPTDTDRLAEKIGAIGSIELRPSIYNRLRLSYNFSRSIDEYVQRQATFDLDRNREFRETTNWKEKRSINLVTLEVENNFDRIKLDYALSFARSSEVIDERLRFRYERDDVDFADLTSDPEAATPGPAGELELRRFGFEKLNLSENIAIGGANLTWFTSELQSSYLKTGIRYRIKDRRFGSFTGVAGLAPGTQTINSGEFGLQRISTNSSEYAALNLDPNILTNVDVFEQPGAYNSEEEILGGYLMYLANWSPRFSTSFGLRLEGIELEYVSINDIDSIGLRYNNLFPSFNLTYKLATNRQIRFAFYEAIGRPAYAQLFPTDQVQLGNRRILRGNSDARPVTSRNLDFIFERYGRRDGLISVAAYAKFLTDPFVEEARYEEINDAPFLVTNVVNAKSAAVVGLEFTTYQNLGFLGNQFRYFNVNVTYNINRSVVKSTDPDQDDLPLAGSPRQSANFSFIYDNPKQKISFVFAANFRDRTLDRLQDGQPIYRSQVLNIDLSVDYTILDNISLYARLNNLTNPLIEEYIGVPGDGGNVFGSQQYGSWTVAGLRWRL